MVNRCRSTAHTSIAKHPDISPFCRRAVLQCRSNKWQLRSSAHSLQTLQLSRGGTARVCKQAKPCPSHHGRGASGALPYSNLGVCRLRRMSSGEDSEALAPCDEFCRATGSNNKLWVVESGRDKIRHSPASSPCSLPRIFMETIQAEMAPEKNSKNMRQQFSGLRRTASFKSFGKKDKLKLNRLDQVLYSFTATHAPSFTDASFTT